MEIPTDIEAILRAPIQLFVNEQLGEETRSRLDAMKTSFIAAGNEEGANSIAIKELILTIQHNYIGVFKLLMNADYYAGWRLLERVEIDIKFLLQHYDTVEDEYKILFIKKYVSQLQQLFPYKLFASSE